jgi:hypothetical protein
VMATRMQHAVRNPMQIKGHGKPSKLRVAGSNPAGVAITYFRSIRFKDLARGWPPFP